MIRGALLLTLATLLWSGNYIAGRMLAPAMPAFLLNGVRWTVSAALLLLLMSASGKRIPYRARWRELLLLGFIGMFVFSTLTYLGLHTVPAAQAGMISGALPAGILLLSVLLLHERPSPLAWSGMALSILGVAVLVGAGHTGHFAFSIGDVELIAAALAWGFYTVLGKRFSHSMDALTMTAGAALFGAIPSLAAGLLLTPLSAVHMTPAAWAALLYVSTAASVIAYFVWTAGVNLTGASRSAPFINLLPVWTVVLGFLLLGERLTLSEYLGGAIIVAGALLASARKNPVRKNHA
ncbi:MAG: DMT family transporter [Bacilli bacterium]